MGMKCWNCFREIPDGAASCQFCEASQKDNPVAEIMAIEERLKRPDLPQAERERLTKELDDIRDMVTGPLKMMEPGILEQMRNLANECETADDFMAAIFIGDCPKCGSNKTQDCENVAGIESVTVGRCKSCGTLFCSDCGHVFVNDKVTTGEPKCSSCGSEETNFVEVMDGELPTAGFDTSVTCFACDRVYCGICGNPLPGEDDT
jgi:hypothetical protein